MRPNTLLVLALVVAALAGFIWLDREALGTDERAQEAKLILPLDSDEITAFAIERQGEITAFERQGVDWRLVSPVSGRADASLVEGLLAELVALEKERTLDQGQAIDLGLAPPRATVELTHPRGEARILIGGEVPASDTMIVAPEMTGPYHVVAESPWAGLSREVDDWRVRTIFPAPRDAVVGLALTSDQSRVALTKQEGGFVLESPPDQADEGTVSRLLEALVSLEATEFLDDRAVGDEFGLDSEARHLEVSLRGVDEPWRLTLGRRVTAGSEDGSEPEGVYARAGEETLVVPDVFADDFGRPAADWRSLEWIGMQVHEIDRLELRDVAGDLVLEREGGSWLRDGLEIEYAPVSDLIYELVGAKAMTLDAAGDAAGEPTLSLTLNPGEDERTAEVLEPADDLYPASVSNRTVTLWLGGETVRSLLARVAAVRQADALVEVGAASAAGAPEPATAGENQPR